ncbi:MAG: hypothetical protein LIO69_08535 [Oscillospiraceae bacterium]|nr:hypothetical protein [Oscillospiraceae bacterium]
MKIKKRYWVISILCCVLSVVLAISVGYLAIEMVRYNRLNKIATEEWIESDLFVTTVESLEDATASADDEDSTSGAKSDFSYIGNAVVVSGKFEAYGKECYGSGIVVNLDAGEEITLGTHITIYFKPDNPRERFYVPVTYGQYIILIIVLFVIDIALVVLCRIMNKSLNNNTFSDAKVNIMDIPIVVLIGGILIGLVVGLVIGNLQIDSTYTVIDAELAQGYADLLYAF